MAGSHSFLTALPPELRLKIYAYLLDPDSILVDDDDEHTTYHFQSVLPLLLVNKQTYHEAIEVFRRLNILVCIETPWPQSKDFISEQGQVPTVHQDAQESLIKHCSLLARIDAPGMEALGINATPDRFVLLLRDLPKFTQAWAYVDLEHEQLNMNLRLRLELLEPYASARGRLEQKKELQRRLFLPFGEIRGLACTEVIGSIQPDQSVTKELTVLQNRKRKTPESCLREATKLRNEGSAALAAGDAELALQIFDKAWEALLIVVNGGRRHVHCENFFARRPLVEPPYTDKSGNTERLLVRCELVADTCLAYLKLERYQDCIFWGMRSITLLRQSMGIIGLQIAAAEEAIARLPGSTAFGRIYRWTAAAYKAVGDRKRAYHLYEVAREHLEDQRGSIDEEMAGLLDSAPSTLPVDWESTSLAHTATQI